MAGSNFIIIFNGNEGTSPLVRILNNFDQVSVIHQTESRGWEPFEGNDIGSMSLGNLKKVFDLIYGIDPLNMAHLNQIYTKTGKKIPLEAFNKNGAVGFKMRFVPPPQINKSVVSKLLAVLRRLHLVPNKNFKKLMFDLLKEHNVVVFLAIRQDVLRMGLSLYHDDMIRRESGKPGQHLQFRIAGGRGKKEDIPRINVDCDQLEKKISLCEHRLQKKRSLMEEFEQSGVRTIPLIYENFCNDKFRYFYEFFRQLQVTVSKREIETALGKGAYFQKVHSDDISEFVVNHEEVLGRFRDRYVVWY